MGSEYDYMSRGAFKGPPGYRNQCANLPQNPDARDLVETVIGHQYSDNLSTTNTLIPAYQAPIQAPAATTPASATAPTHAFTLNTTPPLSRRIKDKIIQTKNRSINKIKGFWNYACCSKKQSMADLKLRRLQELNSRLKEDLDRPRVKVAEASISLINYCNQTRDYMVPSVWGQVDKKEDPYNPQAGGSDGCCVVM